MSSVQIRSPALDANPPLHPHHIRHNYATRISDRFGIEEASNMLDDSSVKMTEVYAERDREQALEIANRVG